MFGSTGISSNSSINNPSDALPTLPPFYELRLLFFKSLATLNSLEATLLGSLPPVLLRWRLRAELLTMVWNVT